MNIAKELKSGAKLAIMLPVIAVMTVPFMIFKLLSWPFEKPLQFSTQEVAAFLRKCIDGEAEEDELDYFTSVDIADPRLAEIMNKVGALFGPHWPQFGTPSPDTRKSLEELLRQVESMSELASS
jgi:hypothetical protein